MDQELDIVVTGLDVAQGDAARGIALAFDLSTAQAEQFVKELPRVAKRRASQSEAARYVAALRAIGARVETKASEAPRPTLRGRVPAEERVPYDEPSVLELPFSVPDEPRPQAFAAQGLAMISNPPPEALNPSIPRAPAIPHDMNRMPNAAMQMPSLRPDWLMNDAQDQLGEAPRRHTDAHNPPPLMLQGQSQASANAQARVAPERALNVGMAHEPIASKPAAGTSPSEITRENKQRALLGLGILLAVAAIAVGGSAYRNAQERRMRVASMTADGIEPGEHSEIDGFLTDADHEIEGIDRPQLFALIHQLQNAGSTGIWAARIKPVGGALHAQALLIALPADDASRAHVLEQVSEARRTRRVLDHGQRWELLKFEPNAPAAAEPPPF